MPKKKTSARQSRLQREFLELYNSSDEQMRAILRALVEAHCFVGPHRGRTFHLYESAVVSRIAVTMPWLVDDAVATVGGES